MFDVKATNWENFGLVSETVFLEKASSKMKSIYNHFKNPKTPPPGEMKILIPNPGYFSIRFFSDLGTAVCIIDVIYMYEGDTICATSPMCKQSAYLDPDFRKDKDFIAEHDEDEIAAHFVSNYLEHVLHEQRGNALSNMLKELGVEL